MPVHISNKNSLKWNVITIVFILASTFLAYSNTFNSSWHLDDLMNITENRNIRIDSFSSSELDLLLRKSFNARRFIANLSFAVNYYFHKYDVFGYHLVNIIIHILTAITVYFFTLLTLSRTFLKDSYGKHAYLIASCTAIIFAAHPVQTQSVTYIVQRMASMAALFYLLSMVFYIKGRLSAGTRRILFFTLSIITAFLAFGTKENTVVLPYMIFLYELFFFNRVRFTEMKRPVLFLVPLIAVLLVGVYMLLSPDYLSHLLNKYSIRDFTMAERLLTEPRVVLYYLTLLVFPLPSRLNLDYDYPVSHSLFDPPTTFISIIIIAGLILFSIIRSKKMPLFSFFIIWYFANLAIESSIFPLEIVFEHRVYLPSVGFIVLAVVSTIRVFEYIKVKSAIDDLYLKWTGICLIAIVTALLFAGTYQRNFIWKDEYTLWSDVLKKSPNKARAHFNLGDFYKNSGRYNEAESEWKISLRLEPKFSFAHSNLANVYFMKNEYEKAEYHYLQAIKLMKDNSEALYNLANLLTQTGRPEEALIYYEKFIKSPSDEYELQKKRSNLRIQQIKAGLDTYK